MKGRHDKSVRLLRQTVCCLHDMLKHSSIRHHPHSKGESVDILNRTSQIRMRAHTALYFITLHTTLHYAILHHTAIRNTVLHYPTHHHTPQHTRSMTHLLSSNILCPSQNNPALKKYGEIRPDFNLKLPN